MSASGVAAARPEDQRAGGGATPTLALQSLIVSPIPLAMAKELLVREHYLHSFPGGTHLALGVFRDRRLMGALTLGAGPANAHAMVKGAELQDCLTLTRLWWEAPEPVTGDVLRTTTGRQYAILNVRGKKLDCLVMSPGEGTKGRVFDWRWTRRRARSCNPRLSCLPSHHGAAIRHHGDHRDDLL